MSHSVPPSNPRKRKSMHSSSPSSHHRTSRAHHSLLTPEMRNISREVLIETPEGFMDVGILANGDGYSNGTPHQQDANANLQITHKKLSPLQIQLFLCNPEKFEYMREGYTLGNQANTPVKRLSLWQMQEGLDVSDAVTSPNRAMPQRPFIPPASSTDVIEIEDSSDDDVVLMGSSQQQRHATTADTSSSHDMDTCTQEEFVAHCENVAQLLMRSPSPRKPQERSIAPVQQPIHTPPAPPAPLSPPLPSPSTPHFTSHELHFTDFTMRFFPHQDDHLEIIFHDSFYFIEHQRHAARNLSSDLFSSPTTYHKNRSYFLNLNHPIILPHNVLRFFRKLSQLLKVHSSDTTLLHYFRLFQPQSCIIFQSPTQIKNFINNIVDIIPELNAPQHAHILDNFTFYDAEETYEDDELVYLLHSCVRNLFEHRIQLEDNVVYHGEVLEDDQCSAQTPHGFGRRVTFSPDANDATPSEEYVGYWKNGMRHGEGHLIEDAGSVEYHGDFCDDQFEGEGTWKQRIDTDKYYLYNGDFRQHKRHGYGVMKLIEVKREVQKSPKQSLFRELRSQREETPPSPIETITQCCKEWYRGEWSDDFIQGFGEMRSVSSWKMGHWLRSRFVDGCGMTLNQETEFFERLVQSGNGDEILKPLVPKGYFDSLLKPQLTSNVKQAQRVLYKGYCFRSRLETRWALFFEFLGMDFLYECKKFALPDGRIYTPDFYIPKMFLWIEIKPMYPTEEEREKAQILSRVLSSLSNDPWRVLLIYGDCEPPFLKKHHPGAMMIEFFSDKLPEEPCIWVQCTECLRMDAVRRGHHVACACTNKGAQDPIRPALKLQMAYEHARKFDFEAYNLHLLNYYDSVDLDELNLGNEDDA